MGMESSTELEELALQRAWTICGTGRQTIQAEMQVGKQMWWWEPVEISLFLFSNSEGKIGRKLREWEKY